jgi:hypothetical protein
MFEFIDGAFGFHAVVEDANKERSCRGSHGGSFR